MKQSKKIAKQLAVRQHDFFVMVSDSKKEWTGFKKPGGKTGSVNRVKSGVKGY